MIESCLICKKKLNSRWCCQSLYDNEIKVYSIYQNYNDFIYTVSFHILIKKTLVRTNILWYMTDFIYNNDFRALCNSLWDQYKYTAEYPDHFCTYQLMDQELEKIKDHYVCNVYNKILKLMVLV